jgi:hypothetical protein
MSSLPAQIISQLLLANVGPFLASSASIVASSYFTPSRETFVKAVQEVDDEREVDLLQMDRMLTWMRMVFDMPQDEEQPLTVSKYKQELYSIYMSICADYNEYKRWSAYNRSLWLLSGYRKKNTKQLARKILSDIRLFKEGLQMFSTMKSIT